MSNPAKFVREVRQETSRVTWPTRKETYISVIMVLVLVLVSSLFFLLVDSLIAAIVQWILDLKA